MKKGKSAGDGICAIDVFKGTDNDDVLECVKCLFNFVNRVGVPEKWKSSLLMPLYKKGDKK